MPTFRTRANVSLGPGGHWTMGGSSGNYPSIKYRIQTTEDVTGNYGGTNHFDSISRSQSGDTISGPYASWVNHGLVPFAYQYLESWGLGSANTPATVNTLLARTSPSRPEIDLPVFVSELHELPKLVLLAGNTLLKKVASGNLAYQFGWKPLLGDLEKLMKFSELYHRRVSELDRLHSNGGLKRRKNLGESSTTSKKKYVAESANAWLEVEETCVTTAKQWGTVRWIPLVADQPRPDPYMSALRAVLGLDLTMHTLWEMIPFSWMVDWFTDVGDFLAAQRGTIPALPVNACLMTHINSTYTAVNTAGVTHNFRQRTVVVERKMRQASPVIPGISASLPHLSGTQLSILASLSVLREGAFGRR